MGEEERRCEPVFDMLQCRVRTIKVEPAAEDIFLGEEVVVY